MACEKTTSTRACLISRHFGSFKTRLRDVNIQRGEDLSSGQLWHLLDVHYGEESLEALCGFDVLLWRL
jgi:hypothetical protein